MDNIYEFNKFLDEKSKNAYLATEISTQKLVVIKSFEVRKENFPNMIEQTKKEYYFMTKLDHPNIVKGFDFFELEDRHYIVMEYVEGVSLQLLLQHNIIHMTFEKQLEIAIQICSAVVELNKNGIAHGNLDPFSIIITDDEKAKILNLGIIKNTKENYLYTSPEQISTGEIGKSSNVFSLAVILYQFFLCEPCSPFFDSVSTTYKVCNQELPDLFSVLGQREPKIISVSQTIQKALHKDPSKRIESTKVFLDMLLENKDNLKNTLAQKFSVDDESQENSFAKKWLSVPMQSTFQNRGSKTYPDGFDTIIWSPKNLSQPPSPKPPPPSPKPPSPSKPKSNKENIIYLEKILFQHNSQENKTEGLLENKYEIWEEIKHFVIEVYSGCYPKFYWVRNKNNDWLIMIKFRYFDRKLFTIISDELNYSSLEHPNIFKIIDSEKNDGFFHIIVKNMVAKNLHHILSEKGKLFLKHSIEIAIAILKALEYAFSKKVIHGNLSASSILIDKKSRTVQVMGFINKKIDKIGMVFGELIIEPSFCYEAPDSKISFQSDMYSVGAIFYHMIYGEPPNYHASLLKMVEAKKSSPNIHWGIIDSRVEDVIKKTIALKAEDRYNTYEKMIQDFESLLEIAETKINLLFL